MKRFIKYLLILFTFVPFININAVSSDSVDYTVKKYYVDSEIEIAGGLSVTEIIEVDGTYNGYYRNISTRNNSLVEFTGLNSDLKGSSIYNPTGVANLKVAIYSGKDVDFNNMLNDGFDEKDLEYMELVDYAKKGDKGVYTFDENNGVNSIKMFNETKDSRIIFVLSYVITNILVEHNDCAEFYYTFISKDWSDPIEDVKVSVALPYASEEIFKVWAHGQLSGEVIKDSKNRGIMASITNYKVGSSFDIRTVFDKSLFQININESKNSKMDALPIIESIENERANEANSQRKLQKTLYYGIYVIDGIYILSLLFFLVFVFIRYDREIKPKFKNKYNREFINDYDVEVIEYLMNKNITANGFSTSILNLIYKGNINVEKIEGKKKEDYKFVKLSDKEISESEKIIIDLLFNTIGSNNEVLLSEVKRAANNTSVSGNNKVYNTFLNWQSSVTKEAEKHNFYVDNGKVKLIFTIFGILGFGIAFLDAYFVRTFLIIPIVILSIIFIIYIVSFTKRSQNGNEDYAKWKAFKNFLEDFGRFKEKELPEIKLWERYLVYASIFGIADKVRKTMKVKFEEIRPEYTMRDSLFDYYIFTNLARDLNHGFNTSLNDARVSVAEAKSRMSSGSGGGGGFSSGGGFGGGGNSGGGF